jgi:hypothetical protein
MFFDIADLTGVVCVRGTRAFASFVQKRVLHVARRMVRRDALSA